MVEAAQEAIPAPIPTSGRATVDGPIREVEVTVSAPITTITSGGKLFCKISEDVFNFVLCALATITMDGQITTTRTSAGSEAPNQNRFLAKSNKRSKDFSDSRRVVAG